MIDVEVTDEELAELALAADPDEPVDDDAVPLRDVEEATAGAPLLPGWYMPSPATVLRPLRGWSRWVAVIIIAAFVAINAYGLCSTYGPVAFG
ncbi:MAG: hypothetical protein ACRD2W_02205 [Acidimicrobiales bacterium]